MKFGGERGRSTFKRRGNDNNQRVQCWRCTSYYHSPSTCHALEKVCRKCHAKGHIERACRENPKAFPLKRRASEEDATAPKPKRVAAVQRETEDEKDIVKDSRVGSIDVIPKGDTTCYDEKGIIIGYVANIPISFLIDSGAEVNTVNGEIFNKLEYCDKVLNQF
nr:uncharacterized protein LOC115266431 [Aedes albopictus]